MKPFIVRICLLLAVFCTYACHCSKPAFQTDTGQPIPPLVLTPFFPSPVSGGSASVVDLATDTGRQAVLIDSSTGIATKGPWFRSFSTSTAYIDYMVVGQKKNCNFVLIARSISGTNTQARVMVIRYKGHKLHKKKSFDPGNIRDYPVVIDGNRVFVDSSGAKK